MSRGEGERNRRKESLCGERHTRRGSGKLIFWLHYIVSHRHRGHTGAEAHEW